MGRAIAEYFPEPLLAQAPHSLASIGRVGVSAQAVSLRSRAVVVHADDHATVLISNSMSQ